MGEKLLIIGNGMASVRLVETLVQIAPERFHITIVGAEMQAGYNRVLLSALLARDILEEDIILKDRNWYQGNNICLISGKPVVSVDAQAKIAVLSGGQEIAFDACVFATGSNAIRLPIAGIEMPGVVTFRDLSDVTVMEQAADIGRKITVIGGGLLGIEAAYGLAKRGADVTLVHVMDRLMERQLDAAAAGLVKKALGRKRVKVLLQKQSIGITGKECATGIAFADGTSLEADLVVCAVGIKPNSDLAKGAGLAVNRGIVVDDHMAASLPGFYAIGECAEHRGTAYGLVEPAYAQAETLAKHLIGQQAVFEGMILATNLKVSGLPVFSAGMFMGGDGMQVVTLEDRKTGSYRKLVLRDDCLVGCVLVGEAEDALWYLELIRSGSDISLARHLLIHGRDFAEAALANNSDLKAA